MKKYHKFPHLCSTRNCRRKVGRAEHSDKCYKCRLRAWKAKHPIAYAWGKLKRRARGKGIKFTLTIADYARLSVGLDLAKMEHRTSLSLVVDRKDASLGYHAFNCKRTTLVENSRRSYVPYWSGGIKPHHTPAEIRSMDVEYRNQCEKISDDVGGIFEKGSDDFWKEFHRRKINLFESVEA